MHCRSRAPRAGTIIAALLFGAADVGFADQLGGLPSKVSWRASLNLTAYSGWWRAFAPVPLGSNNYCREWLPNATGTDDGLLTTTRVKQLVWCSSNPQTLYGDACSVPRSDLEAYSQLCSPLDLQQLQLEYPNPLGWSLGPSGQVGRRDSTWGWLAADVELIPRRLLTPNLTRLEQLFTARPGQTLALASWGMGAVLEQSSKQNWFAVVCSLEPSPLFSAAGLPAWRYCCHNYSNVNVSTLAATHTVECLDVPPRLLLSASSELFFTGPEPCEAAGSAIVLCSNAHAPQPWLLNSVRDDVPAAARLCRVYCRWPCRGELPNYASCTGAGEGAWAEPRTACPDSGMLRLRSCDRSLHDTRYSPCRPYELALATRPAVLGRAQPVQETSTAEFCAAGQLGCQFDRCRCWQNEGGAAGCCPRHSFCHGRGHLCERGRWLPALAGGAAQSWLAERPYAVCLCDEGFLGERCEEPVQAGTSCHLSARTRALSANAPWSLPSRSPSRTPSHSLSRSITSSRSPTISISPTTSPSLSASPSLSSSSSASASPPNSLRLLRDQMSGLCLCTQTNTWQLCPTNQTGFLRCAAGWSGGRLWRYADPANPLTYLSENAQTDGATRFMGGVFVRLCSSESGSVNTALLWRSSLDNNLWEFDGSGFLSQKYTCAYKPSTTWIISTDLRVWCLKRPSLLGDVVLSGWKTQSPGCVSLQLLQDTEIGRLVASSSASRTPVPLLSPTPLVNEARYGPVYLVVSVFSNKLQQDQEELWWLRAQGRGTTTLTVVQTTAGLDPRAQTAAAGGLADLSMLATLEPHADRVRYSVTFYNETTPYQWQSVPVGNNSSSWQFASHPLGLEPPGSVKWFTLRRVSFPQPRWVQPGYAGPLYNLVSPDNLLCVAASSASTALSLQSCGNDGTELYVLTRYASATPTRTPTPTQTPSPTPTRTQTQSPSPTPTRSPGCKKYEVVIGPCYGSCSYNPRVYTTQNPLMWCPPVIDASNILPVGAATYGNTFSLTLAQPYKVFVRRTDNPGADWGMDLRFNCEGPCNMCNVLVQAGPCSSNCNAKIITMAKDIYWCPSRIDKNNWATADTWNDVYETWYSSTRIYVRRVDNFGATWGLNLQFYCYWLC